MERLLRFLFYGAVITPLLLIDYLFFPYITSKMLALEALILVALLGWVALWRKDPGQYQPKITWLVMAIAGYLGVSFIAALQGINFWRSFWSTFERMDGVFTWICLFIFIIVLETLQKTRDHWTTLLRASLAISIVIDLKAVSFFGIFSGELASPLSYYGTYGIFGNTLYLAIYSVAHIVIALILMRYLSEGVKTFKGLYEKFYSRWGIYYVVGLVSNSFILLLTGARGPLLGLLLGSIVGLVWYSLSSRISGKLLLKGGGIGILLLLALLGIFRNTPLVQRLTTIGFSASPDRLINWEVAYKAFQERPVLGWGSNNYLVAQNEFFNPRLTEITRQGFDRTHNKYLEILVDTGVIGFIAYTAIFAVVFWQLFRRRKDEPFLTALLAGFFIAYLFQNITVFDTPGSYFPLFLLLAFVNREFMPDPPFHIRPYSGFVVGLWIIGFLFLWQGVWQPLQANVSLTQALAKQKSTRDYAGIIAAYNNTFSYQTYGDYEARLQLGTYVVNTPELSEQLLDYAIQEIEKEQRLSSDREVIFNVLLAKLYESEGVNKKDPVLVAKGEEFIKKAIALAPARPDTLEHYIVFLLNEGRYAETRAQLDNLKKLSEVVYYQRKAQYYLALSYFFEKNYQAAYDQFKIMVEKTGEGGTDQELTALAQTAEALGNLPETVKWYKMLVDNDRRNPRYHMVLADTYRKVGDAASAKEEAQFALLLDPSLSGEIQKFLDSLPH